MKIEEDGRLLFYVENQGVYLWTTASQGDDPPVWGKFNEEGEPWVAEEATLSGFLIQVCMLEATFAAPYGASAAWADEETLDRVTARLRHVPLGDWRWPAYPGRFHTGRGIFVFSCPNGQRQGQPDVFSIWVGARTELPLADLKDIVKQPTWEYMRLYQK